MGVTLYPGRAQRTYAVFIDLGFLRRRAAEILRPASDQAMTLSPARLVEWFVGTFRPDHLLRIYVYDGEFPDEDPRHAEQAEKLRPLKDFAGITVRLGTTRSRRDGDQQKGVDSLLIIDMLELAWNGAYDFAVVLAGDADFAPAVAVIQRNGRQACLVIPEDGNYVNEELRQSADQIVGLGKPHYEQFFDVS